MSLWIIYSILIALWVLLVRECQGFRRLGRMVRRNRRRDREQPPEDHTLPPVSVIIPVKNQYDLLAKNLPMFLTQDYPEYEVWVVDMSSTDDTRWLLAMLMDTHKNLHHTALRPTTRIISQECLAYTLGFRAASYEWVMLSRIDCVPESRQWLKQMGRTAARRPERKIIAGYTRLALPSHSWAGLRLRFLHAYDRAFMLPHSIRHRLHTADGTNIMYRKSLFMKYHGFRPCETLTTGAVEVLVNRHSTRRNTITCLHPDAILTQQIAAEEHHWREERQRLVEVQRHFKHLAPYRLKYACHLLLPWIFALWFAYSWHTIYPTGQWGMLTGEAAMLLIIILMSIKSFNFTLTRVGERPIFFSLPFLILLAPYWHIEAHVLHLFADKRQWRSMPAPKDDDELFDE